jgi:myo-inositol-1-phosphate synthase
VCEDSDGTGFPASNPLWAQKFADAKLPIIGDDIKSQLGATIVHRVLARLVEDRDETIGLLAKPLKTSFRIATDV